MSYCVVKATSLWHKSAAANNIPCPFVVSVVCPQKAVYKIRIADTDYLVCPFHKLIAQLWSDKGCKHPKFDVQKIEIIKKNKPTSYKYEYYLWNINFTTNTYSTITTSAN